MTNHNAKAAPDSKAIFDFIIAKCSSAGVRLTTQRRLIAHLIAESEDHPNIRDISRRVAQIDRRVSLATVYRTLRQFERIGATKRLTLMIGPARYEAAYLNHHDHLIDLNSGKVIEFRSLEIEALQNQIATDFGYKLIGHRLELYAVPFDR